MFAAPPASQPAPAQPDPEIVDGGYDEKQKFDDFFGNDIGLLTSADDDEYGDEADAIYSAIDQRMDLRLRKRLRSFFFFFLKDARTQTKSTVST